jgi:hypothetical protein
VERSESGEHLRWADGRRLRSGALLVVLLVGIGVAAAALVGILAVAVAALMDRALG